MPNPPNGLEGADRAGTFVPHAFPETLADLGEVRMNYATAGEPHLPALLLIPGQSESWWGYEAAIPLLAAHFHVHAVDLRGQGRSSWTPGRYTLDNRETTWSGSSTWPSAGEDGPAPDAGPPRNLKEYDPE